MITWCWARFNGVIMRFYQTHCCRPVTFDLGLPSTARNQSLIHDSVMVCSYEPLKQPRQAHYVCLSCVFIHWLNCYNLNFGPSKLFGLHNIFLPQTLSSPSANVVTLEYGMNLILVRWFPGSRRQGIFLKQLCDHDSVFDAL